MVRTIREAISEVLNDPGLINRDEIKPNKYIYLKLIGWADLITKRDSNNKRLFGQRHLFRLLEPCTQLVDVENDCCDIPNDVGLKRTNRKIPNTLSSQMGSILNIFTVGQMGLITFKETTPTGYASILRRSFQDPNIIYYWRSEDYLYFPNIWFDEIRIEGAFIDSVPDSNGECHMLLDNPFICPDYLFEDVRKQVVSDMIMDFNRQKDQVPDLNSNIKTTEA